MTDFTTVAQELLRLRNEIDRLEAEVALRNSILKHLDDKTDAETIVSTMRGDLLRALLAAVTPRSTQ
jgi:hypothetical protein